MLTQKQYEIFSKKRAEIYVQMADLMVEKRLSTENISAFSDAEFRGASAT